MNEFRVEWYIDGENKHNPTFLSANKQEIKQWKRDIEARALSEYYNKKIIVSDNKI